MSTDAPHLSIGEFMGLAISLHENLFLLLKERGNTTPEIERDFKIYLDTARSQFDKDPDTFSFDSVNKAVENNRWIEVFKNNQEEISS